MSKNKIRLEICGAEYIVGTEDSEEYVRALGKDLDKTMKDMIAKNDHVSITMAAVIAALSYSDEAQKAKDAADNLRSQIRDYLEDSSRARMEADEARREIERMKHENQTLRARLSSQESEKVPKEDPPPRPIASSVPVQRPQAGVSYSRVQATQPQPCATTTADQNGFMSFFEKKDDEL